VFVAKAKDTLSKLNALVEIANDLGLNHEATNLRDATVQFIGGATEMYTLLRPNKLCPPISFFEL